MLENLQHLPSSQNKAEQLQAQFSDLAPALNARQAIIESQRCLYCYDAPCTRICPTEIDVPSFIQNIATGNINGAAKGILEQNILGASCSRVCPTEILCEHACVRNHDAEGAPVKIGLLQRYALDHMQFAQHPFERAAATGKKIAIVGAGPAGLSCAHQLARLGHDVVIFEAQKKSGGLNEYGIAKYKLTNDAAQKEVEFLLAIGGIQIRHEQVLGSNLQLADLQRDFDAVFLAIGLATSRQLGVQNEASAGMLAAVDYIAELRQATDLTRLPVPHQAIILGAGNTAIDMAVQIARLGAEQVTLVYRRGAEHMSATLHEQAIAKDNQVRIITWAKPDEVLLDVHGKVRGMRFEKMRNVAGKAVATGDFFELAGQAIFKAIGQELDAAQLKNVAQDLLLENCKIHVDSQYRTNLSKVFAGGDCIPAGQDLTVQAVQHGKLAALAIHQQWL